MLQITRCKSHMKITCCKPHPMTSTTMLTTFLIQLDPISHVGIGLQWFYVPVQAAALQAQTEADALEETAAAEEEAAQEAAELAERQALAAEGNPISFLTSVLNWVEGSFLRQVVLRFQLIFAHEHKETTPRSLYFKGILAVLAGHIRDGSSSNLADINRNCIMISPFSYVFGYVLMYDSSMFGLFCRRWEKSSWGGCSSGSKRYTQ